MATMVEIDALTKHFGLYRGGGWNFVFGGARRGPWLLGAERRRQIHNHENGDRILIARLRVGAYRRGRH